MQQLWLRYALIIVAIRLVSPTSRSANGLDSTATGTTVLTGLQGRINSIVRSVSDSASWHISPSNPSAATVQFVFTAINMLQAELQIYDASLEGDGVFVFSCASCGSLLPPPFSSSTGLVGISVKGVPGVGFLTSSFSLQYIAIPAAPTPLLASIRTTLNMGAATIEPVSFQGIILPNSTQQWSIQQSPGATITFSFAILRLGDQQQCSTRLEIFDRTDIDLTKGSTIYSSCNDTSLPMRWVYSHTGASTVLFTNEGGAVAASFQLSYYVDAELYHCGSFIMPALVVGQSVIITDGSKSTNLMRRGESCSWLIQPVQDCPVSLLVNWVSIKHGSYVNVYDGSSSSDSMLWNAVGATGTVPPIILSTGNSLFMEYFSGSAGAIRYFGFEAETSSLFQGSKGSGRGFSSLAMSSAIDIAPPIRYTGNNFYVWYIRPAQSIGFITFAVSELALPYPGDQLLILDGDSSVDDDESSLYKDRVLAQFSGNVLPLNWVTSSSTVATLLFRTADSSPSSSSVTSDLFKVSYHSDGPNYHCGFTTNPAVLTSPSFLFTDGSSSTEAVYSNQQCDWSIQLTTWNSSDAHSVVLLFDRFDLHGGGSLSIYREGGGGAGGGGGALFTSIMDSSAVPGPIVLGGQSVQVSYRTGAQSLGRGFSLIYYGAYSSHSFPGNNIVTLRCSSVVSLTMTLDAEQLILPNTNLLWLLKPANSTGSIYLSLIALNLSEDCETNYLDIFDGDQLPATSTDHLMGRFCRGSVTRANYRWLQSTSSMALLHFVSDHRSSSGNFDISYFADGPNYHCGGFVVNPAHVRAPSMVFTDGSGSGLPIFSDQYCEWVLEPSWYLFAGSSTAMGDSSVVIVIEFLQCDLQGGSVQLFDGRDAQAPLLWSCLSCSVIPFPIVSTGGVVFVRFETTASSSSSTSSSSSSSEEEEERGRGFTLMYWSTSSSALHPVRSPLAAQELVLQLPAGLQLTSDTDNATAGFSLASYDSSSTLEVHPAYVPRPAADAVRSISDESYDGRPHNSTGRFESLLQKQRVCGTLLTSDSSNTYLQENDSLQYKPTQLLRSFLSSTASSKAVLSLQADSIDGIGEPYLAAPSVCKYRLESGSAQAIAARIVRYVVGSGRLRIFIGGTAEGMSFEDHLLYDSEAPPTRDSLLVSLGGVHTETTEEGDSYVQSMNVTIPCGKSTMIVEQNTSCSDSSLLLRFGNLIGDTGEMCSRYVLSLQPTVEQKDPLIPVYIAAACIAFMAVVGIAVLYIRHSLATQGYVLYPSRLKPPVYRQITPIHPPHGGRWDRLFNWLLPRGTCVVCKTSGARVLTLNCAHRMCVECVSGYVESALGDVSMFPVKCPMHFEGCAGSVGALIAKRVLGPSQYNRFNEFSDRAIYGDGMRCIFCRNFVNFPLNMDRVSRVECPYCRQLFCVRCKQAWHEGVRCAADTYDDSLEAWKISSGAQKCPACRKLIEKDDPDTCNHMVHKATDGIPCSRDRTDFCYCCGEEICGDYPHWEVRNATVNHFPDGVFQKCRVAARREREKLREAVRALDGDADLSSSTSSSSSSSPRRSPATVVPLEILWLPTVTVTSEQPALRDNQRDRPASTHDAARRHPRGSPRRVSIAADTVLSNRIATPSSSPTRSGPSPSTGHHPSPSTGHHPSPSTGHHPSPSTGHHPSPSTGHHPSPSTGHHPSPSTGHHRSSQPRQGGGMRS